MRIAVVTTSYPTSDHDPSGHFVASEVALLRHDGHDVTVVCPRSGGAFGWPGVAARVKEHPWRAIEASTWPILAARQVQRVAPHKIIAHWAVPSAWPIASLVRGRVELEVVSHGGDIRLLVRLPLSVRCSVVRRITTRATQWRFVSDELMRTLHSSLPAEESRMVGRIASVRPSAIALAAPSHVRAEATRLRTAIRKDNRLYVCAGRLVRSKRVDRIVDYVATANACVPAEQRVLVVLGDGPDRARIESIANRWRLDARFLGTLPRPTALAWISAADEFVHASEAEGLSTVLREAAMMNVPITKLA